MNFSIEREHIQKLLSARNSYMVLALCAMTLCVFQMFAIFLLIGREKIVLVPPEIKKSFWVSASQVSPEYLSEMTSYFSQLRFNVTSASFDHQRELLLRYVDPQHYNTLKTKLIEEGERINTENLTMSFYPVNTEVDVKHFVAMIEGDLKTYIGETALPVKRLKLKISYSYDSSRLLVKSFEEVKHD